jgi:integrase
MAVKALKQWKLQCPPGELVFPNQRGGVVVYTNFHRHVWKPLLKDCGGLNYEFHSLRHAAASLFIERMQWSPKRIQTVMGHSSIVMTYDRYGHLFDTKDDSEALKRLEAAVVAAAV